MSAPTVGEAFADAVTLAIEKERDDVLARLFDGMADIGFRPAPVPVESDAA